MLSRTLSALAIGLVGLIGPSVSAADQLPGVPEPKPVVLTGATIHTVSGATIERGYLRFDDGRIQAVGSGQPTLTGKEKVIDMPGKHICPAFIACSTQLGLVEIGAVRATRDQSEVGSLNPNVRAEVSVNPDSELIPVARAGGVGYALSEPTGGILSGTSALLRLDGWTWEELSVVSPAALHIRWPGMNPGRDPERPKRRLKRRNESLAELDLFFREAQAYWKARTLEPQNDSETDLRYESLRPFLSAERPVFLHANDRRSIRAALDWASIYDLRVVVVGGYESVLLAEELKERGVSVIYGPVHQLPRARDHAPATPFEGPARLDRAGVSFAMANFKSDNARNLPHNAATAAAFGLPREKALRAITLSAAEILGVERELGSIEVGKQASLLVLDGDPLEVISNVEFMWLEGLKIDLSSRHTQLYDKYRRRLERR